MKEKVEKYEFIYDVPPEERVKNKHFQLKKENEGTSNIDDILSRYTGAGASMKTQGGGQAAIDSMLNKFKSGATSKINTTTGLKNEVEKSEWLYF
jgi:hypothetical protein